MEKVVAFVPIKLNNQRLPGKNLLPLGEKVLCQYIFEALLDVGEIDRVVAYCSDEALKEYLPSGVEFLQRDASLDGDMVKGLEIYHSFASEVDADVYVLAHATAPFLTSSAIREGLDSVLKGESDSAFSVERLQTFAWYNGEPINYALDDIPRTQDMTPVYVETSGFYIFRREVLEEGNRRIGNRPKLVEVGLKEAVDIDELADYELAKRLIGA